MNQNKSVKLYRAIFCFFLFVILSCILIFSVSAAGGSAVNLANVDKNQSGEGYYWNNIDEILTLDGISIDTDEDFGLKLPAGATVELKGTNRISAEKYAVGCPGSVNFKGDGELILEAGECALYSYSTDENHKIKFSDGKYKFSGDTSAVSLDGAELSVTGGMLELNSSGEFAIDGRVLNFTGGSIVSTGAIHASHLLKINRASFEVSANEAALRSDNLLDISNVKLSAGTDSSSLTDIDEYSGERCLITVPEKTEGRHSIIFGEDVSGVIDYIALAVLVVLIVAAAVVPILYRKRKTAKLYAELENKKNGKK